jgi:hypothetical protein
MKGGKGIDTLTIGRGHKKGRKEDRRAEIRDDKKEEQRKS